MPYPVLPPAPPPVVSPLPESPELSNPLQVPEAATAVDHTVVASAPAGAVAIERFPPERSPAPTLSPAVSPAHAPTSSSIAPTSAPPSVLGTSLEVRYDESTASRAIATEAPLPDEFSTTRLATRLDAPPSPAASVSHTIAAVPTSEAPVVQVPGGYSAAPLPILDALVSAIDRPFPVAQLDPSESGIETLPPIDNPTTPGQQILVIPPQPELAPPLTETPSSPEPSETGASADEMSGDSPTSDEPSNADTTDTPPEAGVVPGELPPDILELRADRQEYDTIRRIVTAEGNAVMNYRQGVVAADRLQISLDNRTAVAQGDAVLTRGEQTLRGDRFTYNFTQQQGRLFDARGEVFLPSISDDFSTSLPTDVSADQTSVTVLTEDLIAEQPVGNITSSGGLTFGVGDDSGVGGSGRSGTSGTIRRLRFEAEQIDIDGENWEASNVRITNDPFSPPELELRSSRVRFTRLSPTRSEIRARNPRVVFDQGFSLPLLRNRVIIDEEDRNPALVQFGYDEEDRGGLYIERTFDVVLTPTVQFSLTPQILIQRILDDNSGDFSDLSGYGLRANLRATLDPLTNIEGVAVFNSLDPDDWSETSRRSLRIQRRVGTHRLNLEYSYRDRLFNGSLGFQNVQQSLGLVLTSPNIELGDSEVFLSYQVGAQYINARTDRQELWEPGSLTRRADLGRFQASAALSRGFYLWQGEGLPPTPTEGLRYTSIPIIPYVQFVTGVRGTVSHYTSGDTQTALTPTVGLRGQFGHFSRDFLDYTGFNISYSHTFGSGESPFLFDRVVDRDVISFGIIQQVYGPFRIGFQTSISIDNDESISTDYILEYSRRSYTIALRYNPVKEVGLLTFRINDFNWSGTPERFSGLEE